MADVLLRGKDICKSFANNGRQNHVLNMLNIEIYEGDFTIIMGSSGSGKSTLLYALSGMDKITNGEVQYKEEVISGYNETKMAQLRANDFGFVFQQSHLVSNLTLFENVAVTGYLKKDRKAKDTNSEADKLLKLMSIEEAKDRLPSQVSGGEAQRTAIARAMINHPAIIFADEPTGALNKKNSEDVLNILTSINEKGQSILMVTHDIRAAIRATRLLYLEDGKIIGEMKLNKYSEENAKARETQVNAWLSSLNW